MDKIDELLDQQNLKETSLNLQHLLDKLVKDYASLVNEYHALENKYTEVKEKYNAQEYELVSLRNYVKSSQNFLGNIKGIAEYNMKEGEQINNFINAYINELVYELAEKQIKCDFIKSKNELTAKDQKVEELETSNQELDGDIAKCITPHINIASKEYPATYVGFKFNVAASKEEKVNLTTYQGFNVIYDDKLLYQDKDNNTLKINIKNDVMKIKLIKDKKKIRKEIKLK